MILVVLLFCSKELCVHWNATIDTGFFLPNPVFERIIFDSDVNIILVYFIKIQMIFLTSEHKHKEEPYRSQPGVGKVRRFRGE